MSVLGVQLQGQAKPTCDTCHHYFGGFCIESSHPYNYRTKRRRSVKCWRLKAPQCEDCGFYHYAGQLCGDSSPLVKCSV